MLAPQGDPRSEACLLLAKSVADGEMNRLAGDAPPRKPLAGAFRASVTSATADWRSSREGLMVALSSTGEEAMPYVNIKITREGATRAQKAEIIKGVTDLLVRVLDKDPNGTFVVIDEIALEDWGVGGLPVDEFRRKLAGE
jgi:4-oxalocrotonate tautomerase